MENWREELNTILEGIDEEETHNEKGWWETSLGAEFGREVKVLIIKLIDQELEKAREEEREKISGHLLKVKSYGEEYSKDSNCDCNYLNGWNDCLKEIKKYLN